MKHARRIFDFLSDARGRGERAALVTITNVIGSSSRAPGMHMAVSETGASLGSLSAGCVEAAIIGEAIRVIAAGQPESIRFGVGSPFLDIRLPCGGGMDVFVLPEPPVEAVERTRRRLAERRSVALAMDGSGRCDVIDARRAIPGWADGVFTVLHQPDLRLLVVGQGAETEALARLAWEYGAEVLVLTPDEGIAERVRAAGPDTWTLNTPASTDRLACDAYSAVVMLFHDHDWEPELLRHALVQSPFYVGAMGSRRTHANRLSLLRDLGVDDEAIGRLTGPIGLIPATRDPDTLALSVLAQIVGAYEALLAKQPRTATRNNRAGLAAVTG